MLWKECGKAKKYYISRQACGLARLVDGERLGNIVGGLIVRIAGLRGTVMVHKPPLTI